MYCIVTLEFPADFGAPPPRFRYGRTRRKMVCLTALWDVRSDTFRSGFQAYVRVDLRGGHAGVPEQFLHGAHVRAALDQVRGETEKLGNRLRARR